MRWKPLNKLGRQFRSYLPELNFITIHYLYFMVTTLVSAAILWGSATPSQSLRFIDALFLSISAMTEAGLNTVNLSTLNTFQQFVLFFLIIIGSAIFVSAFVVHVRRRAFDQSFRSQLERESRGFDAEDHIASDLRSEQGHTIAALTKPHDQVSGARNADVSVPLDIIQTIEYDLGLPLGNSVLVPALSPNRLPDTPTTNPDAKEDEAAELGPSISLDRTLDSRQYDHIVFNSDTRFHHATRNPGSPLRRVLSFSGVGARPPSRTRSPLTMHSGVQHNHPSQTWHKDERRDLASVASVSRNSNFHHLTEADRLRLGGREYRAVTFLGWIVPIYFVIWQLLSCLGLGAYVNRYFPNTTRQNGLNPW
jgi:hypothetical protein